MAKEKQKMTLNVRRRSDFAHKVEPPPPIDSSLLEVFANGAEKGDNLVKVVEKKVIRDAFTMPSQDHIKFAQIQKRCLEMGIVVTKSEIVRAGLSHLLEIDNETLKTIMDAVPKLKTGRPTTK